MITVRFTYLTGLKRPASGTPGWRGAGTAGPRCRWRRSPREDGCPAFTATVDFDDCRQPGRSMRWGVRLDGPAGRTPGRSTSRFTTPSRRSATASSPCPRPAARREERYYFTYSRRLGAQKTLRRACRDARPRGSPSGRRTPGQVEVVFGRRSTAATSPTTGPASTPHRPVDRPRHGGPAASGRARRVADFSPVRRPAVHVPDRERAGRRPSTAPTSTRAGRSAAADRTPRRTAGTATRTTLDGTVSCSVVIDQDVVREEFEPTTVAARD